MVFLTVRDVLFGSVTSKQFISGIAAKGTFFGDIAAAALGAST
jgi:hypothetical protein